jgi:uncharacterized protein (DUF3820 family)
MTTEEQQKKHLLELAFTKMPFGKYKGYFLSDIPEPYYVWFRQKGFPNSKIGKQLEEMYEIKLNGLESIFYEIRKRN